MPQVRRHSRAYGILRPGMVINLPTGLEVEYYRWTDIGGAWRFRLERDTRVIIRDVRGRYVFTDAELASGVPSAKHHYIVSRVKLESIYKKRIGVT